MLKDRYDNPLHTESAQARDAYVAGVDLFLAVDYGAVSQFETAVAADPGFVLGHAALARARMMDADGPGARAALAEARARLPEGAAQLHSHVTVFEQLLAGQPAAALETARAHLATQPRDAMIAQCCSSVFGLIGFSGRTGREAELLAFTASLLPHYGDDWWMLTTHAVSLCEIGQPAAADAMMDRALAMKWQNAQAAHFKAHSLYEQGQTEAGLTFLNDWLAGYDRRGLVHGHLNWHSALWALETGDEAAFWHRIETAVRPAVCQGLPINILTDMASILYRAELAGMRIDPALWHELSAYASAQFPRCGQSFVDAHAALAHAMAGETAELERVIAEAGSGFAGDLAVEIAKAWRAVAARDWQAATQHMIAGMANHERLGGSRAQRDLLEFALMGILLRLGRGDEARNLLALRRPGLMAMHPVAGLH